MKKETMILYTIEREFLGKFSVEELLVRIVKSHLEQPQINEFNKGSFKTTVPMLK